MITRRDFLKIGAAVSLFMLLPVSRLLKHAVVEAEFKGRVYRGTSDGKIYVSEDQRKSWNQHINLGSGCAIANFYPDADKNLHAQVDYQGHPFYLSLAANAKDWLAA